MSPAGYWPQLEAAIEAGADAVYFGLKHFTARAKVGFGLDELPDVMTTLHRRGVRGYVTFNTLIFAHEIAEAARTLAAIAAADADAVIVQDIGIAQLSRQIAPDLEVHGSTQMSVTSAEGVDLARRFGASRVVLGRELSLAEIRQIVDATDCEIEMFVHGALCVSYSGQCFSSEAWGGRSANRGKCAQACRLPYTLLVDDAVRPLGDARYLLSPGDLYALHEVPQIIDLGVSAIKIEGRYKDSDYVALTTAAYRKAVDEAWAGLPLSITPAEELQLEQVYSRGLGPFFVAGTNHQTVVDGRAPRHRGVQIAQVVEVRDDTVLVRPAAAHAIAPLKAGDGLVFDAADWRSPEQREEGGRAYGVDVAEDGLLAVRFGAGAIDTTRIRAGDLLWRTSDPDLAQAARPYLDPDAPVSRQAVDVHVTAQVGETLVLQWSLAAHPHVTATVAGAVPLAPAQKNALSEDHLRAQLGRLGGTPYTLGALTLDLVGTPFVPASVLNDLRRAAVEQLVDRQMRPRTQRVYDADTLVAAAMARSTRPAAPLAQPALHLLVRTPEQLDAAIGLRPASITLDYLELYGLRPAVERVQAAGIDVRVASPRVLKPSEQRIVHFLKKLGCAVLVRSGGLLEALRGDDAPELLGDFSLNAANVLTAQALLDLGMQRITPTHDLNAAQVANLAAALGADRVEVIAYHHLPVFHTEHCVFCRFLSRGTSYKDCGHPCETHRVALRDDQGRAHPVMADVGCRNTVFGAEAQEASRHLAAWRAAGIVHYRLEFVHETAAQVEQVGRAWQAALSSAIDAAELTRRLARVAPQGTTEGSLFVPDGYMTIPLMT